MKIIEIKNLPQGYKNVFVRESVFMEEAPIEFERCYLGKRLQKPCFITKKAYPEIEYLTIDFSEYFPKNDLVNVVTQKLQCGRFLLGLV